MYAKIFDSMYEGTLYGHWQAIVTLQQMLVLCDPGGVVDMTPQAISGKTSIPLEIIIKGIEVLSEPDPFSRTPGEDGKRIALIDSHRPWGWYIVNHAKYQKLKSHQEKLEADKVRIAEKRKANKSNNVADSRSESHGVADVAHSDSYSDIRQGAFTPPDWVPLEAWTSWLEVRKKKRVPNTVNALKLAVRELEKLKESGNDPQAVLEQAAMRGYQGLFPVSGGQQRKPGEVAL